MEDVNIPEDQRKAALEGIGRADFTTLLQAEIPDYQSGRYYGSDGVWSPVYKYRSPGDPPYDGSYMDPICWRNKDFRTSILILLIEYSTNEFVY